MVTFRNTSNSDLWKKLSRIRLLAMDIDGVLTDGGVYVLDSGEELRRFNIKDGLGLKQLMAAGIEVAWISNGGSPAAIHRARSLGVEKVFIRVEDKLRCLEDLCQEMGISLEEVAYIGDDLTDQEVLRRVGVALAPRDAIAVIQENASLVTSMAGGQGAVREVCDWLLQATR